MIAIENSLRKVLEKVSRHFVREKERAAREDRASILSAEALQRLRERNAVKEQKLTIRAAAWSVMEQAYSMASGNGKYSAQARQIMYAARPLVLELVGKCWSDSNSFTQGMLPDYMAEHPQETAGWDVVFDARGHFVEPHVRTNVGIGTLEVRGFLNSWTSGNNVGWNVAPPRVDGSFPTCGPVNRYKFALFVEKEGFGPLLKQSQIAERYDIAIFSSKGESVMAPRRLVDELSQAGVTVLIVHDFDHSGFLIAHWLSHDSPRYKFKAPPKVIDLGLRLDDVNGMHVQSEPVIYKQRKNPGDVLLHTCDGVSREEINFLVKRQVDAKHWSGKRVELNAMTSPQLIDWLEQKFKEHGVEKVVPARPTLEIAWRRAQMVAKVNAAVDAVMANVGEDGSTRQIPRDLGKRLRELLDRRPELPWDEALVRIAAKED